VSAFDDTLAALEGISLQRLRAEVYNLRAIKAWALDQLAVDFKPGDRVTITSPKPSETGGGWSHYREALAPGRTGSAGEITFNEHANRWQCLVGMDRTWSVHCEERYGAPDTYTRYWFGPVGETPDGHEPPSGYDQERHPEGQIKYFAMDVAWLASTPIKGA